MGPRLVLTGANGFVGRQLILAASAERWDVAGIVRSSAGARLVAEAGGRPIQQPGLDVAALREAFAGAQAIVHLAQIGSERPGATFQAINVEGTRVVAAAARAAHVPRIVYFSGLGIAHYGQWPRCTNAYFLSKLTAEAALLEAGLEVAIFRPSYIIGPGDAWAPMLLKQMADGEVERVGDGRYRMQPIAVRDAARLVLAAAAGPSPRHRVFDLVGPEAVACQAFYERLGLVARREGKAGDWRIREVPVAEADRAARAGGYRGMGRDELDCLLCDEVGDPRPLEALLGAFLTPLDDAIAAAVRGV
jgi:nucleoside-diphosphate-sugar epimerase